MIGIEEKLTELVDELRRTCREDDWWDFKETHYEDRAALLHDIICLANNRATSRTASATTPAWSTAACCVWMRITPTRVLWMIWI